MRPLERAGERGFSYLEVMVATVLTIAVIMAASTAVASALHGAAIAAEKMALTDDALNTLADVRSIVAYGDGTRADRSSQLLPQLFGRSSTRTIARPGASPETIVISVDAQPANATRANAQVTVSADGVSVTERQWLTYEAPAPGSSVSER